MNSHAPHGSYKYWVSALDANGATVLPEQSIHLGDVLQVPVAGAQPHTMVVGDDDDGANLYPAHYRLRAVVVAAP